MKEIKLKIKGMHCKSCAVIIEDSLEEMDGVIEAKASYELNEVKVKFDESKTNLDEIKLCIKKEGYDIQ